jgi:hypothetical protein
VMKLLEKENNDELTKNKSRRKKIMNERLRMIRLRNKRETENDKAKINCYEE